jgi:crotonobetainyl-CoA:carnitine CoA-transferase CaiB-like acyl-CoA transferase
VTRPATPTPGDHLPLADLRVVDLTVARAGPTCVRQLADWGADVVRVEPPAPAGAGGNVGQGRPRPRSTPADPAAPATGVDLGRLGSDFQNLHRNKRSLGLDLRAPGALDVLLRLVDGADVLVENMRPPVKERLGFGWDVVHARNPRLVYGSISGFGQDGPYAERGGVDQIAQGIGGLMSVTGAPGGEPTRVGIPVSDLSAGLYLAVGILVALHDRERTGVGRWVQTSLVESMVAMMDFQAARWTVDGVVPAQEGNHHPTLVPMGCFASSDGYVNIAGPAGRLLTAFCAAIGLPGLPQDPRFSSVGRRSRHRDELNALVAERLRARTTAEWVEVLNAAGVPCGPVYAMDEVFADPQVEHLGMAADPVDHPDLGPVTLVRNAVRMTGAAPTVRAAVPAVGADTAAVLDELGYTSDEVAGLRRAGAIGEDPR